MPRWSIATLFKYRKSIHDPGLPTLKRWSELTSAALIIYLTFMYTCVMDCFFSQFPSLKILIYLVEWYRGERQMKKVGPDDPFLAEADSEYARFYDKKSRALAPLKENPFVPIGEGSMIHHILTQIQEPRAPSEYCSVGLLNFPWGKEHDRSCLCVPVSLLKAAQCQLVWLGCTWRKQRKRIN